MVAQKKAADYLFGMGSMSTDKNSIFNLGYCHPRKKGVTESSP